MQRKEVNKTKLR